MAEEREPDFHLHVSAELAKDELPVIEKEKSFFESRAATAAELSKYWEDRIEKDRRRAGLWGKGVLAVATTVITALGIGKITDFLPSDGWDFVLVGVGFAVAVAGAAYLGFRLNRVDQPIVMRAKLDDIKGLRRGRVRVALKWFGASPVGQWKELSRLKGRIANSPWWKRGYVDHRYVDEVYKRFEQLNGICLGKYSRQSEIINLTLERVALLGAVPTARDKARIRYFVAKQTRCATTHPDITLALEKSEIATQKSALVTAEVRAVMSNAAAAVVRSRSVGATSGHRTAIALLLVPLGVLGALMFAQYSKVQDTAKLPNYADMKSCLEAATTIEENGLAFEQPKCDGLVSKGLVETPNPELPPLPADVAKAKALVAIATQYDECVSKSKPVDVSDCAPLLSLLQTQGG